MGSRPRLFRVAVALVLPCLLTGRSVAGTGQQPEAWSVAVRSLLDAGRYEDAQHAAEQVIGDVGTVAAAGAVETEAGADILVEALTLNGRGAQASTLELANRVVRAKESRHRPGDRSLASSLRNLGDVLVQSGEYVRAVDVYDRALRLREQDPAGENADLADYLDHFARALARATRYDQAARLLDRSLQIKRRVLDPGDPGIARTLEVLGWLFQLKGDYVHARPHLERALSIREATAPTHPEIVGTLNLLGDQCWFEGNAKEARDFYVRALNVGQRSLRANHPEIAFSLLNLAAAAIELGDSAEAKALRTRALAIAEANFPPTNPLLAGYLNDLAISEHTEGDFTAARVLFERALKIRQDRLGPDHLDVATAVHNLAILDALMGDYVEARRLHDRAVAIWRTKLGPEHPYIAAAFLALGQALLDQGLSRQAQSLFQQAVAIREHSVGPNHPDLAVTLAYLAKATAGRGDREKAMSLFARAEAILERADVRETRALANVLNLEADNEVSLGTFEAARQHYVRALEIMRRTVGPSHPDYAQAQAGLAQTLAGLGESTPALETTLRADDVSRQHLRLTVRNLPERQSLAYASTRPRALDLALSLSTTAAPVDPRIFDALIRSRALVLDEMAARARRISDVAGTDVAPEWAALAAARQRLANLVVRGPQDDRPEKYLALVDDARREKERAEGALAARSADFRNELARAEIGLDEVRAALPARSALVSFASYDRTLVGGPPSIASQTSSAKFQPLRKVRSYIAFVVTAASPTIAVVPLGTAAGVNDLVARWHEAATDVERLQTGTDAEDAYRVAGTALRRRVWDPLSRHLPGVATVFVVPEGTLNLVSLAALPIGQTKYLLEQGPIIHYLSAERDIVTGASAESANVGLLAVGGAAFDDATVFAGAMKSKLSAHPAPAGASGPRVRGGCDDLSSLTFGPLDATSKEVHEVAGLWTQSRAQILENHAATERAFKTTAPGQRVLHLATHGFFLGACGPSSAGTRSVGGIVARPGTQRAAGLQDNPLLLSGLAMAGANRRRSAGPNDEDGILTAEEVASLNLNGVEWAVLSACDTGLGEVRVGEGVLGLRRAFQVAGVHTVIMSLWSVEDQATLEWMRALYVGRTQKGLSTAEAMRAASLSVLRARRARGLTTHPFYWGGFIAAGDWR
jgi:CHAT domain-containing protein/tetratricopeptide (TPR) repeat protein